MAQVELAQDTANGARGLGFDSRAGQIRHSVAKGSSQLRGLFGPKSPVSSEMS